jgi:hypothetical protein
VMSTTRCQVMVLVGRRSRCSNTDGGILLCNLVYMYLDIFQTQDVHSEVIY